MAKKGEPLSFSVDTTLPKQLTKEGQFFCLIGKNDTFSDFHSFIHIGYKETTGKTHTLLEIGKIGDRGFRYGDETFSLLANALFSKTGAVIVSENHQIQKKCSRSKKFPINYVGFKITECQYLYFLGLLKVLHQDQLDFFKEHLDLIIKNEIEQKQLANSMEEIEARSDEIYNILFRVNGIKAFQPISGDSGAYQYLPIEDWQGEAALKNEDYEIISRSKFLGLTNTCRHTARDFLCMLLNYDNKVINEGVSACFTRALPCKVALSQGSYQDELYLLPQPPSAYQLDSNHMDILYILYQRMERLLKSNYDHPVTRLKFNKLSELYESLTANAQTQINFLVVIEEHWQRQDNKEVYQTHRGWHAPFFHRPITENMFRDLIQRLQTQITKESENMLKQVLEL